MKREVNASGLFPRVIGVSSVTSGGNTVTTTFGKDDFSSIIEGAAGLPVYTFKQPFKTTPIVIGSVGTDVAAGGYAALNANVSVTGFSGRLNNAGGTAVDGTVNFLIYGYMAGSSTVNQFIKPQKVTTTQRDCHLLSAKVTGSSGALVFGSGDIGCTRTGTGAYTLTFKRQFGATPIVIANAIGSAAVRGVRFGSKTASGCTLAFHDNTATAQDTDFYVMVYGTKLVQNLHGGARDLLRTFQRKPRIQSGFITVTAGVPSLGIAGDVSSVTDSGVGDYIIGMARRPYRREPACFALTNNLRTNIYSANAGGDFSLLTRDAGGTATDVSGGNGTYFLTVGSDDPGEY